MSSLNDKWRRGNLENNILLGFIYTFAILVVCLVSLQSANAQSLNTTSTSTENNYLVYTNPNVGLTIKYPSAWEKVDGSFSGLEVVNHLVTFISPEGSESPFTVLVHTEDLPTNVTLKQYVRDEYNELVNLGKDENPREVDEINREAYNIFTVKKLLEMPQQDIEGMLTVRGGPAEMVLPSKRTILNDSEIKINGYNAWKVDSKLLSGIDESDIYILGNGKAFVITYFGAPESYNKYSPVVHNMLNSITLKS